MQKKQLLFVESLLQKIHHGGVLKPEGLFVAQHHKKESFRVCEPWKLVRQEKYGDSLLSFFSLSR
ncbi:MAG: RsmD family RNA methyltransferase [Elusimicrobia bacterium]|nr:RsmD family RNA methyltransferase [Elusimicrobiota bacterium]